MLKSSIQWDSHGVIVDSVFSDRIIIKIWVFSSFYLRKLKNSVKELITMVNGLQIPTIYSVDLNSRLCSLFYRDEKLYFSNP